MYVDPTSWDNLNIWNPQQPISQTRYTADQINNEAARPAWKLSKKTQMITQLVADSGIAYMHAEFPDGDAWPFMELDYHTGVSSLCHGTRRSLWLQETQTTYDYDSSTDTSLAWPDVSDWPNKKLGFPTKEDCVNTDPPVPVSWCQWHDYGANREGNQWIRMGDSAFGRVVRGQSGACDKDLWWVQHADKGKCAMGNKLKRNNALVASCTDAQANECYATNSPLDPPYSSSQAVFQAYSYDVRNARLAHFSNVKSNDWFAHGFDARACQLAITSDGEHSYCGGCRVTESALYFPPYRMITHGVFLADADPEGYGYWGATIPMSASRRGPETAFF
jgi:hypothetical protein